MQQPQPSTPSVLRMDERLYDEMVEHLQSVAPQEGCGLIAFEHDRPVRVYPGTNILANETRYRMADHEVVRAVDDMDRRGWWLGAIYHSHPKSSPRPSTTDLREATWPDACMIIVSFEHGRPDARAYHVDSQSLAYEELAIEVYRERLAWLGGVSRQARETVRAGEAALSRLMRAARRSAPASVPEQLPTARPHPRPESFVLSGRDGAQPAAPSVVATATARPAYAADDERRAVVGILGGMGPLATADLYRKIIEATPAGRDQEHIPVVIHADPRVPDRTEALLHGGADPIPWLVQGAQALVRSGVDFIVMPCNTAHAFLPRVQPEVGRPIVSMIEAAADRVAHLLQQQQQQQSTTPRTVGLLATGGTIASGVYQEALRVRGLQTIVPSDDVQQRCVMAAIAAVKRGDVSAGTTALLAEAAEQLAAKGAQALVAACTEIPVVLRQEHVSLPLVDATDALARMAVATALHLDAAARDGSPVWETSTFQSLAGTRNGGRAEAAGS
jgi:aspartate racemase